MSLLAFDMTRDHPAFGVGIGNFRSVSRHYVTDEYPQLRRWAPRGQNAHNNFLQILGELGIPGLLAFLWLVVPVARRWRWEPASAADTVVYASAMAAGLATFLISALFGHPLLIPQVAAAFFLVLGLTVRAASGARLPLVAWDKSCSGPQSSVWSFRCPGGFSTRGRRRATTKD